MHLMQRLNRWISARSMFMARIDLRGRVLFALLDIHQCFKGDSSQTAETSRVDGSFVRMS